MGWEWGKEVYHYRYLVPVLLNDLKLPLLLLRHISTKAFHYCEISDADSAKYNKIRSLGGRQ